MRIFPFIAGFSLGIAVFLLGLNLLGQTLTSVLGFRLRALLQRFTANKVSCLLTGILSTTLLQSSSAVNSTMVVLVDSEVLSLRQAFAVMLGANIGTTLTVQIMALPVEKTAFPLIILGLFLFYAAKRPARGSAVFSLGAVFFGLSFTTKILAPILGTAKIQEIVVQLAGTPLRACILGALLTALVHSSSAVTGLVASLVGQGSLALPSAVGLALGSNVGTVLTTILASAGRSRASRATALAELLFNLGGVLLTLPVYPFFLHLIRLLSRHPSRQVAHAHTIFNLLTALITMPLLEYLARLAWVWAGILGGTKNN